MMPSPEPDGFYTGNDVNDLFVGKRQNYYSWNWGDALFVVIDPYQSTETKPTEPYGFTLGKTQYDWFRRTLEGSKAKFKFVFAHQSAVLPKHETSSLKNGQLVYSYTINKSSTTSFSSEFDGTSNDLSNWILYPNLASDEISILFRQNIDKAVQIQIINIEGKIVQQTVQNAISGNTITLKLKNGNGNKLSSGIYVARLFVDGKSISYKKFVVR